MNKKIPVKNIRKTRVQKQELDEGLKNAGVVQYKTNTEDTTDSNRKQMYQPKAFLGQASYVHVCVFQEC